MLKKIIIIALLSCSVAYAEQQKNPADFIKEADKLKKEERVDRLELLLSNYSAVANGIAALQEKIKTEQTKLLMLKKEIDEIVAEREKK